MSHAPANSRRSRCRRPRASSCSVWPPSRVDGAAAPGTCPPETSSIATSSSWAVFEHDLQHGTWIGEREPVSRARPVAFLGATLWHKGCRKAWVSRDGRAVGGRTSVDDDGAMRMSYSRLVGLEVLYRLRRSPGRCGLRRRRTTAAKTIGGHLALFSGKGYPPFERAGRAGRVGGRPYQPYHLPSHSKCNFRE